MAEQQSPAKIYEIAKRLDDAVEHKDIDTALACFTDDCDIEILNVTLKGKQELRSAINWMYTELGDIRFERIAISFENDTFFEEFIMNITKDQGNTLKTKVVEVLVFEDYEVKSLRFYFDRLELSQALTKGFLERRIVSKLDKMLSKKLQNMLHQ
jgi:ketosteroid isomerase-like protein